MDYSKVIVLDLDGIICEETGRWTDFDKRHMLPVALHVIPTLCDEGYIIDVYTARRSEEAFWDTIRFFQTYELDQFIRRIVFDKPIGIIYVDDKSVSSLPKLFSKLTEE